MQHTSSFKMVKVQLFKISSLRYMFRPASAIIRRIKVGLGNCCAFCAAVYPYICTHISLYSLFQTFIKHRDKGINKEIMCDRGISYPLKWDCNALQLPPPPSPAPTTSITALLFQTYEGQTGWQTRPIVTKLEVCNPYRRAGSFRARSLFIEILDIPGWVSYFDGDLTILNMPTTLISYVLYFQYPEAF
jgi:hypothetical protein